MLVNPLAAFRDAYGTLEGMAQDSARRKAGNALAQGDYTGATGALYGRGLLDEGMGVQRQELALQDREGERQAVMSEAEQKEAERRGRWMLNATSALRRLPPEQRKAALEAQVLPTLRTMPGFDDETLAIIAGSDLSDTTLDGFSSLLGQEAAKYQIIIDKDTGDAFAVDPNNPGAGAKLVYDAPDRAPDAPQGFRWDGDVLEYIPGGPADPKFAGTLAGSKRAPPRARASGGPVQGGAPGGALPPGWRLD